MQVTVDSVGRIVIPKSLREALGLQAGSKVDISWYGNGLQIVTTGPTAKIVYENGRPVSDGCGQVVTDEMIYALRDSMRK